MNAKLAALIVVALAIGAAVVAAVAALGSAPPGEPGHTMLHIGCKNHNHGPKWHADHGRALGQPQSRFSRTGTEEGGRDVSDFERRSNTSGR